MPFLKNEVVVEVEKKEKRCSDSGQRRKMDPSSPLAVFSAQISLRRPQNLRDSPLFERFFLLTFLSLFI